MDCPKITRHITRVVIILYICIQKLYQHSYKYKIVFLFTSTNLICGDTATTRGTVNIKCLLQVSCNHLINIAYTKSTMFTFCFSKYMFIIRNNCNNLSSLRDSDTEESLTTRYGYTYCHNSTIHVVIFEPYIFQKASQERSLQIFC